MNRYEEIIKQIENPAIKVISFDIFDTLICRPFLRSEDLYFLIDKTFSENNPSSVNFAQIRIEAEAVLRRRILNGDIGREDITLSEIYEEIAKEFCIDEELAESLMKEEIELEVKYSKCRNTGKMLFEAAKKCYKQVVLTSDMYLEEETVLRILSKNDYSGYDNLYLSSKLGLRKITGNIYRKVISDYNISSDELLHIGDNIENDCHIPEALGIRVIYFPSTLAAFNSYGCAEQVKKICADLTDWEKAEKSIGIGIMRKMAADYYFDNPFREFEQGSDYNVDPEFVGYAALGPELLALNKWIVGNVKRDKPQNIIFLSRDGYIPKKVYDIYRRYHPELPASKYVYISRRTVLPAMIRTAADLYSLPVDVTYQTPNKLIKLLDFCTADDYCLGANPDVTFTRETFQRFISEYIRNGYDAEKHRREVEKIGNYLINNSDAPITADSVLFDMGYSGRIAAAVSFACKFSNISYYFHADPDAHFSYSKKSGNVIRTFFDFNPYMESSLREYSFLEIAASPIAYGDKYEVEFDIGPAEGYGDIASKMQKGALRFTEEYYELFSLYENETQFRAHDAAMIFESFIRYCSEADRKIYENVLIDDELWGGRRDINLRKLMEARLSKIPKYAKRTDE